MINRINNKIQSEISQYEKYDIIIQKQLDMSSGSLNKLIYWQGQGFGDLGG